MLKKCCTICKDEKFISEFRKHSANKDGIYSQCKSCDYSRIKNHKIKLKEKICNFLLQHFEENPCRMCGETNPILLEFDHLRDKSVNVSKAILDMWSIERLQDEIDKCQVLCANCHRMKTAKDQNWHLYRMLYKK